MLVSSTMKHLALLALLPFLAHAALADDDATERYRMPPAPLAAIVDAPVSPHVVAAPSGKMLLVAQPAGLLTIADLSQPELKLGGLRFNPQNRGPGRQMYVKALALVDVATGASRDVTGLPREPHIHAPAWAPDEEHVAFTQATSSAIELWVVDVADAKARRLGTRAVAAIQAPAFQWMPDGRSLVCAAVPDAAPPPPPDPVPEGPSIQEATGGTKSPVRTYQDLLRTPYDDRLFEHYLATELTEVQVGDGTAKALGKPELMMSYEPSPDGKYLLVETTHRPFSHIVPADDFALKSEVRARDGASVAVIADLPAAEHVPPDRDAVRPGQRGIGWRNDAGATLVWAEARDEGEPKRDVPVHDSVWMADAPFDQPRVLAELPLRYAGVEWGTGDLALVTERWWKTRKTRTYRVAPGHAGGEKQVIFDRSSEDRYSDPGKPAMKHLSNGQAVLRVVGEGGLWLIGAGASPEGDRPFVDRFDLGTRKATRVWRSQAPYYEVPLRVLDDDAHVVLTVRQSVSEPPNVYRRELPGDQLTAVTRFPHPAPQLAAVKKEMIRYKRADGVDLTGTLYLPPGFAPGKDAPLPVLMWAYPAEFKSASAAGQVTESPYRFVGPSPQRPLMFVLQGYAVLDDPTFPIVGEGKAEPNDTYVKQLTMGAQAAVDELVRRGVGDRDRMAIGGHSYGAFTTANLLAHTDLFRAGVARSGAYNRTLTPFGFQSEERTFWEARDTYVAMSPFTVADRINEPLLMIHGAEDANPGTFPIQSERLLHAIKGLGGTARLVFLPKESHGYAARESLMHVAWETDRWLSKYVKAAGPRQASK